MKAKPAPKINHNRFNFIFFKPKYRPLHLTIWYTLQRKSVCIHIHWPWIRVVMSCISFTIIITNYKTWLRQESQFFKTDIELVHIRVISIHYVKYELPMFLYRQIRDPISLFLLVTFITWHWVKDHTLGNIG